MVSFGFMSYIKKDVITFNVVKWTFKFPVNLYFH